VKRSLARVLPAAVVIVVVATTTTSFVSAAAAAGPASAPSAAAVAPTTPATRPSPVQLHMQAYEFMLAGQFQRAQAPLEQAYKARPLAQQPRPLILNRAMLDITQKVNIMRPIKDLREYLANLPPGQVDEDAVDLLGAALQAAAKNPRTTELPLFGAGMKQMQTSIELLEQARPRERKWGQKWYRDADFHEIQFNINRATRIYKFEQDQADRLRVELETAQADAARYNTLNTTTFAHRHVNATDAYYCATCRANRQQTTNAENARAKVVTAEGDYKIQKLKADKAKQEIPQPDWTALAFRPFHPNGPAAAVPPRFGEEPGEAKADNLFGDPAATPAPPREAAPDPFQRSGTR